MPNPSLTHRVISRTTHLAAPHIPLRTYRRWLPRNPIGFFYHSVSGADLPHVKHLYPYKSDAEFDQDIRYLKEHFTLVGYPELLAHFRGEIPLPSNAAHISFDDGFSECYTVVRPILLRHNVPCIFFLATDWIDNRDMYYRGKISLCIERFGQLDKTGQETASAQIMSLIHQETRIEDSNYYFSILDLRSFQQWNSPLLDKVCDILQVNVPEFLRKQQPFLTRGQIREMQSEGFVFGAHTRSHPKLGLIPQNQQAIEIVESCRRTCEITGGEQAPFAFPFSGSGVDPEFLVDLRAQHPEIGLIFDTQGLRRDRPFVLHRIWADRPVHSVPPERNLEYWLRDAYVKEVER